MIREIKTVGRLNARIRVPGSKSITNRALVCAALAKGESVLRNASDSDDTALLANGLNQLGVLARRADDGLHVDGTDGKLHAPKFPIPVGNAGTSARFLLALGSLAHGRVILAGEPRLAERPMDELFGALGSMGSSARLEGGMHLVVSGGSLNGGVIPLNGERSSQFLSSLLLVAPYASDDVRIQLEESSVSVPYVRMTMTVMRAFGVEVESGSDNVYSVRAGQRYKRTDFTVEADASSASYFLAAAAIAGGDVFVEKLRRRSIQGDAGFVDILRRIGCSVEEDEEGTRVSSVGEIEGGEFNMNAMPDLVPTLVAVALFAKSPTRIRNVAHLRYKESDRLAALAAELQKLGARISVLDDGLHIDPGPMHGAQLDTYDDHRLAMSLALVGLRVPGVKVENPECVRKSFPTFWKEFEMLYTR